MKVLQIVPEMHIGGVERGSLDLAKALVNKGHVAFVISAGGALVKDLEAVGARHYQLPVHKKRLWTIIRMILRTKSFIRTSDIDIVHARSRVPAWIGFFACLGTSARFVTTAHGQYSLHFFSRVMGWGDTVIAISSFIKEHLKKMRIDENKIVTIPRGVDFDRLPKKQEAFLGDVVRIGVVGRIVPLKGHDVFLKSFAMLAAKSTKKIQGFIIGEEALHKRKYRDYLLGLRQELGLDEKVSFVGGKRDLNEIYGNLDVLVVASTKPEGFGRTIIEAQAYGIPVVSTGIGGVTDIITDGVNGLLVPISDPKALADALYKLIQDPSLANRIANKAHEKVCSEFTVHKMVDATIRVYEQLLKVPRILVIKLSALGDVVLATPTLRALRSHYQDAHISLLVHQKYADLLRDCPYVDRVITYSGGLFRTLVKLKCSRFNLSIDLQNNKLSHWIVYLAKIPVRVGYVRGIRGPLLTHKTCIIKDLGPIESQARLLSLVDVEIDNKRPELWLSDVDYQGAEALLKSHGCHSGDFIVIAPGGSHRWPSKRWPLENFVQLSKMLKVCGIKAIFIGGREDHAIGQELEKMKDKGFLNLIGKTSILESAAVISKGKLFIGGDSAPLHLASGVGVPIIAFFGPTSSRRHLSLAHAKVFQKELSCVPCYSGKCKIKTHDCMKQISVDEVFDAIKNLLKMC